MIGELMGGLLRANLAAAAAIVVVLAVRRLARARFGARAAYLLWLAPPLAAAAALIPHAPPATPLAPLVTGAAIEVQAFVAQAAPAPAGPDVAWVAFALWLLGVAAMGYVMLRRQARFEAAMGPAVVGVLKPRIVTP